MADRDDDLDWDYALLLDEADMIRESREDRQRGLRVRYEHDETTLAKPSESAGPGWWLLYYIVRFFFFLRYGK